MQAVRAKLYSAIIGAIVIAFAISPWRELTFMIIPMAVGAIVRLVLEWYVSTRDEHKRFKIVDLILVWLGTTTIAGLLMTLYPIPNQAFNPILLLMSGAILYSGGYIGIGLSLFRRLL